MERSIPYRMNQAPIRKKRIGFNTSRDRINAGITWVVPKMHMAPGTSGMKLWSIR